jgi:II/X family phage/plasmid replication protein
VPGDELLDVDAGRVWMSRLDHNRNYDFETQPRALATIRALSEVGHLSHRGRGSLVGEGSVYWGAGSSDGKLKGSRYFSMKAYAKGPELKRHKLPVGLPMVAEATAFAQGLVRMEATIRARELRRRGLVCLANWGILGVTPAAVFDDLFRRLSISDATMANPVQLEAVPSKLRSVYQLWQDGHDLRTMFPKPTFYRHRKALLAALNVDIAVKRPRDSSNVVPIKLTLVGREVGVPDWAKGTPLYFDPKGSRAA